MVKVLCSNHENTDGDVKSYAQENGQVFVLETAHTTYAFCVRESGHLEHLYYGEKIDVHYDLSAAVSSKCKYPGGNLVNYSKEYSSLTLETLCQEISSVGKGDVREPFCVIEHVDGSYTSDFVFDSFEVHEEFIKSDFVVDENDFTQEGTAEITSENSMVQLTGLPTAHHPTQQLVVHMKSLGRNVFMDLYYEIYEDCDCITRSCQVRNQEDGKITIHRLMSAQVDFRDCDYEMMHFSGAWVREMTPETIPVSRGKIINSSSTGTSSNRNNPFIILKRSDTNDDHGKCFASNLIYSGNHYECAEVGSFGKLRFVTGINPNGFSYGLSAGETFVTPQAVITFSENGLNDLSHHMHEFVRNHIVRGMWAKKERPVLLNSWEAAYFKFDEGKLLKMARNAAKAGCELFVLDDGWFGNRNDDTKSLGDWTCNMQKLPGGLKGLSDKIHGLGLQFGIWVEPEMVNVDSECYRTHPDWAVDIPGMNHSEGRNQRILNLTRTDVRDYVVEEMTKVFSSADINYVKWDMNRIFSDTYSDEFADQDISQQEFLHRYVLGLYDILERLTRAFPEILFEGCASGGNRFDLGILCYMPQIWASDNTDAWCRAGIQTGYSYGYPMSVVSAHVSGCPNHQTLRNTSIETRFEVAMFGCLGYECNLADMSEEDRERIYQQIALYKKLRPVLFTGDYYRINNGKRTYFGDEVYEWICVSKDRKNAVAFQMHNMAVPNMPEVTFQAKGLDDSVVYHMSNRILKYNVKAFGDLINAVSPIHVKQDSITHRIISKFVKMDGETEDITASGSVFNHCGVALHQNYGATGYDNEVRYYQDFSSRIFIFEAVEV